MGRKYARILVQGHYLFQEANSFSRAKLKKNCELRRTINVQGQKLEHIFAPNGDYCLYYPSNIFNQGRSVWKPFLKTIKRPRNFVGAQTICILLVLFNVTEQFTRDEN